MCINNYMVNILHSSSGSTWYFDTPEISYPRTFPLFLSFDLRHVPWLERNSLWEKESFPLLVILLSKLLYFAFLCGLHCTLVLCVRIGDACCRIHFQSIGPFNRKHFKINLRRRRKTRKTVNGEIMKIIQRKERLIWSQANSRRLP